MSGLLADQAIELGEHYCRELAFIADYSEESEDGWRSLLLRINR